MPRMNVAFWGQVAHTYILFLVVSHDILILSHYSSAISSSFDFCLLHRSTHSSFGACTILLEPPFAILIPSMAPLWVFNYLSAFLSPSNPLHLSCEAHTILSRHVPFEVNGNLPTTIKNKHNPSAIKHQMQCKKKLEVVVFKSQYLVFLSFERVISSKDFQSYFFQSISIF